jgi:hypothetical protein
MRHHPPYQSKGLTMKKSHTLRIAIVLGTLAILALLLPVLGMVLLGLLTLVVPMFLVLAPVLVPLGLALLVGRLRGQPSVAVTEPASLPLGAPALHAPGS